MEKHAVSRLVGSPPGYVGYDEGGQLTEAVRHRPYSLVLLDEVEKAHPDVWNIMLQVFDEGRLTDTQGRTVDFTNTIILLTSNIGSELYYQDYDEDTLAGLREKLLQSKFRPEFINRIDGIVYFHPLYKEHMINILDIQMRSVQKRLKERDLDLILSDNAREWLAENGYDPKFGARPLKRLIKQEVLKPLSNYLLTTNVKPGTIIKMDLEGNSLEIVK
jgi:ATP-dependent Clp protease ATP-binding subunit ClpA